MTKFPKLAKAADETLQIEIGGELLTLNVKTHLDLNEEIAMSEEIAQSCFLGGRYIPAMKRIAAPAAALAYYTDAELPEDMNEVSRIVSLDFESELLALPGFDRGQYASVLKAADELIAYERDKLLTKTAPGAALAQKLEDACSKLFGLLEKMGEDMEVLTPELLSSLEQKLSGGTLTEKGILDAVIQNINARV